MHILDGKLISQKILNDTKGEISKLKKQGIIPKLAVVLVGEHKPSQTYVRKKQQAAENIGMNFELHKFHAKIGKNELIKKIIKIQQDKKLNGLIVQLPLPEPLFTTEVLNAIKPELDVDCMTDINLGKLVMKTNTITPPTPEAVCAILKEIDVDIRGKNVAIIGAGALVGKPLSIVLLNKEATVTTANFFTKNLKKICLSADIIVSAVGKKDLIRGNMIKKGAIVIDTGISFVKGKMYGDVNFNEALKKASYITPVPGGVGPITVALLLKNVAIHAKKYRT
ncbi:MAG: bifunctional 5,10-methylenetetrahydrofolate dehydrogenase/5,10-methenyltetrahydrofolate cyclohydrolase [Candidatus Magasanikbacteria bacterium]|nr:bifunctional 5,10-methylenetetrahydrofolate dehydrogenase/5,10-methenyltetrahydrofolate cyclohydrolase [Candidatus Magasanikbacteria bacterium]